MNIRPFIVTLILAAIGGRTPSEGAAVAPSPESGATTGVVATPILQKSASQTETTPVPARERFQDLTPAEREARTQLLKERKAAKVKPPASLTPSEREARRAEIRQRLQKRVETLREKQKQGTITPEEAAQLKRLEDISKGLPAAKRERAEPKTEKGTPSLHAQDPVK